MNDGVKVVEDVLFEQLKNVTAQALLNEVSAELSMRPHDIKILDELKILNGFCDDEVECLSEGDELNLNHPQKMVFIDEGRIFARCLVHKFEFIDRVFVCKNCHRKLSEVRK